MLGQVVDGLGQALAENDRQRASLGGDKIENQPKLLRPLLVLDELLLQLERAWRVSASSSAIRDAVARSSLSLCASIVLRYPSDQLRPPPP